MNMSEQNKKLQAELDKLLLGRSKLTTLEAGCGSVSHIRIDGTSKLVGIDISEKQLNRNSGLHEKIVGDLQTYPLVESSYDVIVSWDVLEHLESPGPALANLFRSAKKDGIVVLAAPNILSIKGIVTKLLPHALQVAFYRYVIGDKRAGKEDQGPFKTFFNRDMWPQNVIAQGKRAGFEIAYFCTYEGPVPRHLRNKYKLVDLAFASTGRLSQVLSLNKFDLNHSDYMLVLKKTA
jgi:SAM-dependent methyltransferase